MLAGRKGREIEKSVYLRRLPAPLNKRIGFTLVEGLVTVFILLLLISALFLVLNIGNLSESISATKIEVQQEVRRATDWMVKDLRQTSGGMLSVVNDVGNRVLFSSSDVPDNSIFTEPLFRVSTGYDTTNKAIIPSSNQIGYTFDATNQGITRTDFGTNQTWEFNHIANLEFRKVSLDILRVTISGEKTARGTIRPTFTLQEEVKLRN